jgi:hypothetical protein
MRRAWIAAALFALVGSGRAECADPPLPDHCEMTVREAPPCCSPQAPPCWLHRFAPAGGWCPYGCLLGWWKSWCRPHGGCDDYCRKPLPEFKCFSSCHPATHHE